MAAALHFKGHAVVSSTAAAAVWGMLDELPEVLEVTLLGRNANPQAQLSIRRVPALHRADLRVRHSIPLTAPARTLIDLAATLDSLELESALAEAYRRRLTTRPEIAAALTRAKGRAGTGALRQLLHRTAAGAEPARTRSLYERRLLELLVAAELPRPLTNVPVEGYVVDLLWRRERLIVEFDGYAYHGDRAAFERDRLRDQRLIAAGYRVIRITARQLEQSPLAVIARLARALTVSASPRPASDRAAA